MSSRPFKIAAGLAATAALVVPASPAAAETWNHEVTELSFPANGEYCQPTREVTDLRGRYIWSVFADRAADRASGAGASHGKRTTTIRLRGSYEMQNCVTPWVHDGKQRSGYLLVSKLVNLTTGSEATAPKLVVNKGKGNAQTKRTFHWGSTILNVRDPKARAGNR